MSFEDFIFPLVSKTTLLFNILKFLDISKLPILLILPLELSIINASLFNVKLLDRSKLPLEVILPLLYDYRHYWH